jgi:hypothetical protein
VAEDGGSSSLAAQGQSDAGTPSPIYIFQIGPHFSYHPFPSTTYFLFDSLSLSLDD